MPYTLLAIPGEWRSSSDEPNALGLLYTYQAGTDTPLDTYSDQDGTLNSNPVELDSLGRATVFLGEGPYKLVMKTAGGVTVWTRDYVYGFPGGAMSVLIKTADYTVSPDDGKDVLIQGHTASGAVTITLYTAVGHVGQIVRVQKADNSSNALTIDGHGAETVGNQATLTVSPLLATVSLFSDGQNWLILNDAVGINVTHVKFPATQTASSDVNTLDDYEEGSWTPLIGGTGGESGQTYGSRAGTYVKIGKLVIVQFICTLVAKGTITDNVVIGNFPFPVASGYFTALMWDALAGNFVSVVALPSVGTSGAEVRGAAAAATSNNTALTTANITDTTTFSGTIIYHAAN